jgi:hypothetical protein
MIEGDAPGAGVEELSVVELAGLGIAAELVRRRATADGEDVTTDALAPRES